MESKLGLNLELVNQARQSAAHVADDTQRFIDQHTTVTVERAVCRLLGIDGVNEMDVPLPNVVVDHMMATSFLPMGAAWAIGNAMLETGKDLGGNELVGEAPKFAKGAVVSPCSDSVDAQLVKMERKVKAGAEYFQTQSVFEPEKFIKFMEAAKQFGKPVQVGIIIPKSVHADRQKENLNLFGFALTADEHAAIDALDGPTRAGHDPLTFTYA